MEKTSPTHPLRELIEAGGEDGGTANPLQVILEAFDEIIEVLEGAVPLRLGEVRKDFQKAKTDNDLLIIRSEMIAGAELARAGIGFDFGKRGGSPEPDLVLRETILGIEIKARRLDGLRDLGDDLEAALTKVQDQVTLQITCDERPLHLKEAKRKDIVAETMEHVLKGTRDTLTIDLEQPWAATPVLHLSIHVGDRSSAEESPRVLVDSGPKLSNHLYDVETEILAVLADKQKVAQAEAMPTILLVDAARAGLGWIRPPHIWANRLATRLPNDTPFVGVAIMMPSLDKADVAVSLAVRPNTKTADAEAVRKLAQDLGLAETG